MVAISSLKNLGEKSAEQLLTVGIKSAEELRQVGAVEAYVLLKRHYQKGISLNFLYAMEAGLRNIHWQDITIDEKLVLQTQVEALMEIYQNYDKL
ncbi:TfoX/Sxy family DNA transformation protein [Litoribrevibacter albus]|uniref:TfoX C-terminal domain-containing protein n=1 Tax=Litoribrevibacter albus TaxID=1473156 RepID=A0AA37SC45_9GAMM|nr:TfoX/Sxy family DNA transformation protein [Litoribrevibacter albus]GLQ31941.1 hypothetical protein GCM10007876_24200 [Litoribrevibacter albus]